MNDFTLQRIKKTQLASFQDTCTIDTSGSSLDSYGTVIYAFTSGSNIACGYKSNMGSKSYGESETRLKYSAIFRVDDSTVVTTNDRITIKKISGSDITPVQYTISSIEPGHGIKTLGCVGMDL